MLMSGRCGFSLNEAISSAGGMSEDTPGKCSSKKLGTWLGSVSKAEKLEDGMNRVHVKDPSYFKSVSFMLDVCIDILTKLGIAMNMKSLPGQMCR